jgi:hypothetical protein
MIGFAIRSAFTILAFLTFVIGSVLVALSFLQNPPNNGPNDMAEGASLIVWLIWPITLFVTWLFGTAALLTASRGIAALSFLLLLIGVYLVLVVAIVLIALVAEGSGMGLPLRGLPAGLLTIVFLFADIGAAYFAWQYLLQGRTDWLFR